MRLVPRLLVLLAFPVPMLGVAASTTQAAVTRGVVQVWVTPGRGPTSSIVLTGAIGDYGTSLYVDKTGKVTANGQYQKVTLQHGGFMVNTVALSQKALVANRHVNTATCSFHFAVTANATVFGGTGTYQAIRGVFRMTERFAGVGAVDSGQCTLPSSARMLALWGSITGQGAVTFGS